MTTVRESALGLLSVDITYEQDVVLARQRARQIAELVGFDGQDRTRFATAVSELARNAFEYAGGGHVVYEVRCVVPDRQQLAVRITDSGPGIQDIDAILGGRYVSKTGLGLGILGARRLTEGFHIESAPGQGTTVEVTKMMPRRTLPFGAPDAARISAALAMATGETPFQEVQRQNQELLRVLSELRVRQTDVERLNVELAETNRGVLALYAELDDRAQDLKRASEYKTRFLSEVSHELRTPLAAVLNLSRLLLDRTDGELTTEQEAQVTLIRSAAQTVTDLVNDVLDLAKIEAGHTALRVSRFTIAMLFASLRGIVRPLMMGDAVDLVFEVARDMAILDTDEGRLGQILRNFLSNAIKFTERGEVRVRAQVTSEQLIRISVSDTGIGIASGDLERIFGEYAQIDGPVQRRVKGTGLGLALTRRLAALLGGRVDVASVLGSGSTFSVTFPPRHQDAH
ncbi:MAG: ATP-binding protein [Gemmatimonadaceae bacterium]